MKTKRFWLWAVVILVASLSKEGYCGKAVEIDLSKPDTSEVLEEISKHTGLAKDVVELVYEEQADIFKGLDNLVFADKVFNLLLEAKDYEALKEVAIKFLEHGKDVLVEKAFPAAVGTFFTVASVYKTSLELVRDYKWIPGYEEKIYRLYKKQRDTAPTADGPEVWETAFWMGIGMVPGEGLAGLKDAGGYYVVKGKMLDEMVKEKLNLKSQEEAGEQSLKILNRKVDEFWINRLEMRYQQERLKARREALQKEMWSKYAQQLEAIKAAAAQMAGPQRFFLTDKDIPQGWKREMKTNFSFTPAEQPKIAGGFSQTFFLYKSEYAEHDRDEFRTADGKKVQINAVRFDIYIRPRMDTTNPKLVLDFLDTLKATYPTMANDPYWNLCGEFKDEGAPFGYATKLKDEGHDTIFNLQFVKGSCFVTVAISSGSLAKIQRWEAEDIKKAKEGGRKPSYDVYDKTVATEELIRTIGRIVARKIPGGQEKQEEAKAGKKK